LVSVTASAGAVVFIDWPPKSRDVGASVSWAGGIVTSISALVAVSEAVTVSVAVILCLPTVLSVAETVTVPLVRVVFAGGVAAASVVVKRMVPV
jgi:hypothetical protein